MKRDKIREYLNRTGVIEDSLKLTTALIDQMLVLVKSTLPKNDPFVGEADDMINKYRELVTARYGEVVEANINLYDKYYSEEDIDAMLVWSATPAFARMREVSPQLMKEAYEVSSSWSQGLMKQLEASILSLN